MGKLTFVLHDESVNTYGFRMLTSGANLEEFKKNPVMLLNHDDYSLPIGRWENIRVEGGKILADAVFDEGDARAAEVKRKVENDFIRMASIGAWPPEEKSDAYDLMLPGQTLPTVTRWTVREGSVVTIGANHNALVFYDRESKQIIDLNDKGNLIRLIDHSNNPKKQLKMSVLTGVLKLQDSASEAEIVTAIQGIIAIIDLGEPMDVKAIQVNFADHNFNIHAPHGPVVYQYYIEGSVDGNKWTRLVDEEKNQQDTPHKLHTLATPAKMQYLKICNSKDMEGSFSLFDLRIFGQGDGKVPVAVTSFQATRDENDKRIYRFVWDSQENVTGYILRWGTQKEKLTHSMVVYDNQYEARYFNRDSEYYFSIIAFNENGVGE